MSEDRYDLTPIKIWWNDSTTLDTYWKDFKKGLSIAKGIDLRCMTVGMLVEKTDDKVIICQSIGIEGDHVFGQAGGFLVIPKSAIIKIKKLKAKKNGQKKHKS